MLRGTAAATLDEALVGFARIGTSMLACWHAEATMCVALMCDRKTQDSVPGIKLYSNSQDATLQGCIWRCNACGIVQCHQSVAVVLHTYDLAVSHVDQSLCMPAAGWMIFLR